MFHTQSFANKKIGVESYILVLINKSVQYFVTGCFL